MYKLVLYALLLIWLNALGLSFFGLLSFNPVSLLFSTFFILAVSAITNKVFAFVFKVPANLESVYITALILVLLINPFTDKTAETFFVIAFWASVLAQASKYILAIFSKHIFNPVAVSIVLTALFLNLSASWWVGNIYLLPAVFITGLLIVRKTQRFDLIFSFLTIFILETIFICIFYTNQQNVFSYTLNIFLLSPILFFALFMLTEPLTTPPKRITRIIYGAIVGALFSPLIHFGSFYSTPELALVLGNLFSYLASPKIRLSLTLKEVNKVAEDVFEFVFKKDKKMNFKAGQYMEFTVQDNLSDSRGNRRYFTVASSPTEKEIKLGVKYYPEPSTFKRDLLALKTGDTVSASKIAGEFTLPKNKKQKLVFIAGGIGVTPFRSMIKFCLDTNSKRDIVHFYSNKTIDDIAYKNIFDEAKEKLNIKTIYTVTDVGQKVEESVLNYQDFRFGFIDKNLLQKEVPDFKERCFYISGPHSMVFGFEKILKDLGVPSRNIKIDFFPGFV